MDVESEKLYLQNIEEFVLDEDKIVTYKWLSKVLNIHVNVAKQLLYTFASEPSHKASVRCTYLLGGQLQDDKGYLVTVVDQDEREKVKKRFATLCSEHVYSVQKAKCSPTVSTLYTVDSQRMEDEKNELKRLGAIHCEASLRRAAEEISRLRISSHPSVSIQPSKKPSTSKQDEKSTEKPKDSNVEKLDHPPKGKGGIAAMFAAQSTKAPSKPTATVQNSSKGKGGAKKGAGISSFFSKQTKSEAELSNGPSKDDLVKESASVEPETVDVEEVETITPSPKKISWGNISKSSQVNVEEKKIAASTGQSSTAKKQKDTKRKSRGKENSQKPETKKRKRIVVQEHDSSEDDMFGCDEHSSREPSPERLPSPAPVPRVLESDDEDIIPSTPVEESSSSRGRRRRKITKDKTFMDDEGYIVTQKVTEYQSCSESETEDAGSKKVKDTAVKEPSKTIPQKIEVTKEKVAVKKTSPAKSKQQSLMSFFKKA